MTKIETVFDYGQKVKDGVSGIEGIVVAISKWKNGCVRIAVQPVAKNGESKVPETVWSDEMDLEGYRPVSGKIPPGGPRNDPGRHDVGSVR